MIAAVALVNVMGTRTSANVQNWTTLVKASANLLMSAALLWLGRSFTGAGATPQPTRAGIGLVLLGAPAYLVWRQKSGNVNQTLVIGGSE